MNRAELNFETVVLEQFRFLEGHLSFHCTDASPFRVRFESPNVFIEIYHGPYDYELGIHFGKMEQQKRFSFRLFLQRFFPSVDAELGECLAGTPDKVQRVAESLSAAFRSSGQKIIENDEATYREIESVRWWEFRPDVLRS